MTDIEYDIDRALGYIDLIRRIDSASASDEVKFDTVFNVWSKKLGPVLEGIGVRHEWYDPDTSYAEDTAAFVRSLDSLESDLRAIRINGRY